MSVPLQELLPEFVESVRVGSVEIYNEFSLQHELGIFLRVRLPEYAVRFERNVSFFFDSQSRFTKREIDISIFTPDKSRLMYALELKYPRNGQHPEQMFSFCKDIAFLEELTAAGFSKAAFVVFAEDPLFYRGSGNGIYAFFRAGRPLQGHIQKPTGSKDAEVCIRGTYQIEWKPVRGDLRYAMVEVGVRS
jgi:hypothetical protein